MIQKNQQLLNRINGLSDGALVLTSFAASSWLWLDVVEHDTSNIASLHHLNGNMVLALLAYACWTVFLFSLLKFYKTSRTHSHGWRYGPLLLCNTAAVATAAMVLFLFRLQDFSRGVLGLYFIISSLSFILKRIVARRCLLRIRAQGYNLKHVLVVGSGTLAEQYIQCVQKRPSLGLNIAKQLFPDEGIVDALDDALHGSGIDEVVLALDINELAYTSRVIEACEKNGTKISVIPFYNDIIPTNPTIEVVDSVKLIRLRTTPLDEPINAFLKRAFDLVASFLLLVLLSPLFLLIAVMIKLSAPGPVLFHQKRVGLKKKEFTMLKFRSMRMNNTQDRAWSSKQDDRRTLVGSILRKISLDELPQLWNVFKGDMSLVGPRPEIPYYVDQFRETVPLYMVKYQVRPGMTGWAQIHGLRGDTSIPDRIKHDLWYIENWSLWLDIQILFKTAFGGMVNDEQIVSSGKK